LTIDLSEDEDLDDHERDYWMDTVVRPKQVIYWPDFAIKRWRDGSFKACLHLGTSRVEWLEQAPAALHLGK